MKSYIARTNRILKKIDKKFSIFLLINGNVLIGIFNRPDASDIFKSSSKGGSGIKRPINKPELILNKQQGEFNQGDPVHLLCGNVNTDYKLDQFYFNETDAYRVTLQRNKDKKSAEIEQDAIWQ